MNDRGSGSISLALPSLPWGPGLGPLSCSGSCPSWFFLPSPQPARKIVELTKSDTPPRPGELQPTGVGADCSRAGWLNWLDYISLVPRYTARERVSPSKPPHRQSHPFLSSITATAGDGNGALVTHACVSSMRSASIVTKFIAQSQVSEGRQQGQQPVCSYGYIRIQIREPPRYTLNQDSLLLITLFVLSQLHDLLVSLRVGQHTICYTSILRCLMSRPVRLLSPARQTHNPDSCFPLHPALLPSRPQQHPARNMLCAVAATR